MPFFIKKYRAFLVTWFSSLKILCITYRNVFCFWIHNGVISQIKMIIEKYASKLVTYYPFIFENSFFNSNAIYFTNVWHVVFSLFRTFKTVYFPIQCIMCLNCSVKIQLQKCLQQPWNPLVWLIKIFLDDTFSSNITYGSKKYMKLSRK